MHENFNSNVSVPQPSQTATTTPAQRGGWRQALLQVKDHIRGDALVLVAAGVSFFAFLSLFPTLAAVLSVYGLLADPTDVAHQMNNLQGTMPSSAVQLVQEQIRSLARGSNTSLSLSLLISILIGSTRPREAQAP